MANRSRAAKVLAALLISMTVGAIVLLALGNNAPAAGPFCLSSYYRLNSIENALLSQSPQISTRWNRIEVYYSQTKAGNIEQLASLAGLSSPEDLNCHFVVCNDLGGQDGQIQSTAKWQNQWSAIPGRDWYGTGRTIRVCVINAPPSSKPTEYQLKRTDSLVEMLARKFNISQTSVYYPADWR
ncbi:MAG: N-acetylmuramoyl-L-alanine amidase [Phycisphaerae bacterium]|nr:N-acetylmuramoyl-L-alanine amidase [Phycisphaerae bacterium]